MLNESNNNANNGLMTKIWGPPSWISLHAFSFGYPLKPTDEQKNKYKEYFALVGDVLPCKYCRESFKEFISTGDTKLTDDIMKDRGTLTKWLFLVHNAVNKKLGVDYGITYEDVVKRYESYRASCVKSEGKSEGDKIKGCITPLNKSQPYKIAQIKDCPMIPLKLAIKFIEYAKMRGLSDEDLKLNSLMKDCLHNTNQPNNKYGNKWCKRNSECANIIENMRKDDVSSLEQSGHWKGLPTIEELKLIMRLSSNLTVKQLNDLIKKLPFDNIGYKKKYILVNKN
jgi:hypothetical protein